MFMGVVAKPEPEHDFDGKIDLIRVSQDKIVSRLSYSKQFSDVVVENETIKRDWRRWVEASEYLDEATVADIIDVVAGNGGLDQDVVDRLVLRYQSCSLAGNKTWKVLDETDKVRNKKTRSGAGQALRPLTLADLELSTCKRAGEIIQEDCSCDSTFMLRVMDGIGKKIREKYYWVPASKTIYWCMDNAGGHGTKDAIDEYYKDLK